MARFAESGDVGHIDFRISPSESKHRVGLLSRGTLSAYSHRLAVQIKQWVDVAALNNDPYQSILLVGQSIGGLVVRRTWLDAIERNEAWASDVARVVLIAGLSRGFVTRLEPGRRSLRTLVTKLVISCARIIPGRFTWEDALAGSPFVTNLRLTWMERAIAGQTPPVVQVLGDNDSVVHREDSRDTDQFAGGTFVEIAGATHSSILDIGGDGGEDRYLILRHSIFGSNAPASAPPDDPTPGEAGNAVMVVHGIRAGAHGWVQKLRAAIEEQDGDWVVVTPTYRFFSALQFAVPVTRRRKVRWFADQYSRLRAEMPTATFHFAGHSNGTYLLGQCLAEIPAMKFSRVYLAGSVLPSRYEWRARLAAGQVSTIRSDRGHRDIVVALLAKGLRTLHMRDIGGGGYDGFDEIWATPRGGIQWPYFPGGHGAPFDDAEGREGVHNVARYLTQGDAERPQYVNLEPAGWLSTASRISGVALLVLVALVMIALVLPIVAPGFASYLAAAAAMLIIATLAFV